MLPLFAVFGRLRCFTAPRKLQTIILCRAQRSKLDEELATTESKLKQLSAPASLQSILSYASQCIKNAITLVKDPPVDIHTRRRLLIDCALRETTDVIQHALRVGVALAPLAAPAQLQFKADAFGCGDFLALIGPARFGKGNFRSQANPHWTETVWVPGGQMQHRRGARAG